MQKRATFLAPQRFLDVAMGSARQYPDIYPAASLNCPLHSITMDRFFLLEANHKPQYVASITNPHRVGVTYLVAGPCKDPPFKCEAS